MYLLLVLTIDDYNYMQFKKRDILTVIYFTRVAQMVAFFSFMFLKLLKFI